MRIQTTSWALLFSALGALGSCHWPLCEEGCPEGQLCIEGQCMADPCQGRVCGDDGFNGSCGDCEGDDLCREGQCVAAATICDGDGTCPCCTAAHKCLICPLDMVQVESQCLCIDRFEASQGANNAAVSAEGADPWRRVIYVDAEAGCAAAGKRLCTRQEWTDACSAGRDSWSCYPYGEEFQNRCNTASFDAAHPNPYGWATTGYFPQCVGGLPGLYDMSGNMREWVAECGDSSCLTVGGSYHSDSASEVRCDATDTEYRGITSDDWYESEEVWEIGFRCCRILTE